MEIDHHFSFGWNFIPIIPVYILFHKKSWTPRSPFIFHPLNHSGLFTSPILNSFTTLSNFWDSFQYVLWNSQFIFSENLCILYLFSIFHLLVLKQTWLTLCGCCCSCNLPRTLGWFGGGREILFTLHCFSQAIIPISYLIPPPKVFVSLTHDLWGEDISLISLSSLW